MPGSIPPVLLSVLLTLASEPGQQPAPRADALQAHGMALLEKKDFEGAIATLSDAIGLDEARTRVARNSECTRQLARSYSNRGHARVGKGDLEDALADFDKAIALDPTLADAYLNRAFLRERYSDPHGALRDFTKSIELTPTRAEPYYHRGHALMMSGRLTEALRDFDAAIELDPTMLHSYQWRGTIRLDAGELDGVLADAEQLIALSPTYFFGYFLRGMARLWQSKDAEADLDFRTCYSFNPAARASIEQFVADARKERSRRKHETLTLSHPVGL